MVVPLSEKFCDEYLWIVQKCVVCGYDDSRILHLENVTCYVDVYGRTVVATEMQLYLSSDAAVALNFVLPVNVSDGEGFYFGFVSTCDLCA